jgi:ech hydrogenase subunit F
MFRMTKNIFKNAAAKPATRLHPFVVREPFADARGELYNDIDKCIFCMTCARKCPSQCIEIDAKAGIWTCDPFACVYCGVCVDACPVSCLHQKDQYRAPAGAKFLLVQQGEPPKTKAKTDKVEA